MEKVMHGKPYNKCMRVLKYVFDAMTRLKLQSFESWVINQDSNDILE